MSTTSIFIGFVCGFVFYIVWVIIEALFEGGN